MNKIIIKNYFVLIFTIFLLLVSCQKKEISIKELPEIRVLSAKEAYPEALKLAQRWDEKAYLFQVKALITRPENDYHLNIYFTFIAPDNFEEYLLVDCDEKTCKSTAGAWAFTKSEKEPIDFLEINVDSIEAAQIGLLSGGAKYLSSELFNTVTLVRGTDGILRWLALFAEIPTGTIYISIDPYTGEVLEISEP